MAMTTYATSGIVSTPYFGDVFNAKRFKKWQKYQLSICTPFEGRWNSDAGLTLFDQEYKIIIETDIEQMFECIKLDSVNNNCLEKNVTKFQTNLKKIMVGNYTYNARCKTIMFERDFQSELEISNWENKRFTGFSAKWNCTNCPVGNIYSKQFKDNVENIYFVKLANILNKGFPPSEEIWKMLKVTKVELKNKITVLFQDNWEKKKIDYEADTHKKKISI